MSLDRLPATQLSGNTISVKANSASEITANSVNFVNTGSVRISVTQGSTGDANVALNAAVSLGMVIALSGD